MRKDNGTSVPDRALVNQAPAGLGASRFDPSRITDAVDRENDQMRGELYEVDKALGGAIRDHHSRLEEIARIIRGHVGHLELLYQVSHRFGGETRHETALRYIRERDSDGSPKGGADCGSVHDSAGRETASPDTQVPETPSDTLGEKA